MNPVSLQAIDVPSETTELVRSVAQPELVIDPMLDRFDWGYLLRRFWKLFLAVPSIGFLLGVVYVFFQTPLYQSEAVILIDPSFDKILQFEEVNDSNPSDMEALKSLEMAIMTDTVLLRVIDSLHLRDEEGFLPPRLSGPEVPDLKILNFLRDKRLDSALLPETRLIRIRVRDPDAERAQRIALGLSTEFDAFLREKRTAEIAQAFEALEAQAIQARASAMASEEQLKAYRKSHPQFPVEQDHELFSRRLTEFGDQLNMAAGRRMELEGQKQALSQLDPETSAIEIIEVAGYTEVAHVSVLLDTLAETRARLRAMEEQLNPEHPEYRAARAELSQREAELRELAAKVKTAVSANYLAEKGREEILRKEVEAAKAEFIELKALSSEFRALHQQAERNWATHQEIQRRLGESAVSSELTSQISTLISEPLKPYEGTRPGRFFFPVLGGFLGCLVSGGVLVFVVLRGLPVSDRNQLEQRTGARVIADWSDSPKQDTPTRLLQYLGGNRNKTIQITAPQLNGIGASVAERVGAAAASNGRKTLILLVMEGAVNSLIHQASLPNLYRQAVSSDVVRDRHRFLTGLKVVQEQFDNVIIEAGGAGDPELPDYLSRLTDLTVVVVCKDRTKKQLVDERVTSLSRPHSPPVSLILVGNPKAKAG